MFKKESFIILSIYILIIFYSLQGVLYEEGQFISKILLSLIYLLEIFGTIQYFRLRYKPRLGNIILVFYILNLIGFVFSLNVNYFSDCFNMFKNISISLLSFFPFYYYSYKGKVSRKSLITFSISFFFVSILHFFNYYLNVDSGVKTNNVSYLFILIIPYLFLFKNTKYSLVYSLLIVFFILVGAKRGAILSGMLSIAIFYYSIFKYRIKKNLYSTLLLGMIFMVTLSISIFNFVSKNDYLIYRINQTIEGNSSGRGLIYLNVLNSYQDSSLLNQIFGSGFASSVLVTDGIFAHNDWLELLVNFGIIGIVIYLLFFRNLIREAFLNKSKIGYILKIITIIWFVQSIISMGYSSFNQFILTILLAYTLAMKNTNNENSFFN